MIGPWVRKSLVLAVWLSELCSLANVASSCCAASLPSVKWGGWEGWFLMSLPAVPLGEEQNCLGRCFPLGAVNIQRKLFYFHCEIICIFLLREDIETKHKMDHLHLNYLSKMEITHLFKWISISTWNPVCHCTFLKLITSGKWLRRWVGQH